jgi:hypothetical protein
MILSMKYFYSDYAKMGGVKILDKSIRRIASDWDLYISAGGLNIQRNHNWCIAGVDEV